MNATFKMLVPVAAAMLTAAPAVAQSAAIDINGDGMYSLAEVQAALPEVSEDDFDRLDVNNDGLLGADEIAEGEAAGILSS